MFDDISSNPADLVLDLLCGGTMIDAADEHKPGNAPWPPYATNRRVAQHGLRSTRSFMAWRFSSTTRPVGSENYCARRSTPLREG
jgi:hypothetical protein